MTGAANDDHRPAQRAKHTYCIPAGRIHYCACGVAVTGPAYLCRDDEGFFWNCPGLDGKPCPPEIPDQSWQTASGQGPHASLPPIIDGVRPRIQNGALQADDAGPGLSVREWVAALGGVARVAKACRLTTSAVHKWLQYSRFPTNAWPLLVQIDGGRLGYDELHRLWEEVEAREVKPWRR